MARLVKIVSDVPLPVSLPPLAWVCNYECLLVFVKFSSWRGLVVVVLLDRGRNTCFFKATHKLQTCASGRLPLH